MIKQENVPYRGQLSIWSTQKNIWGTKSSRGRQIGFKGQRGVGVNVIFFSLHICDRAAEDEQVEKTDQNPTMHS